SIIDLGSDSFWNTTYDCSQTNIKGGRCVGGNFFSNYTGNDTDDDGIGNDSNYNAGSSIDYLPLMQVYSFTAIDPGTLGGDLSVNSTFNSTNPMTGGSVHSTSQNITLVNLTDNRRYLTVLAYFNESVNIRDTTLTENTTDGSIAVNFGGTSGIAAEHTLYINNSNEGDGVTVCPSATSLTAMNRSCTGAIRFTYQNVTDQIVISDVNVSLEGNEYVIANVSGTGVILGSNVTLVVWDENDTNVLHGDKSGIAGTSMGFFANYTNSRGENVSGATCTIYHEDGTSATMTFNETAEIYEGSKSYSILEVHDWNVTCSKQFYDTLTATDNINISRLDCGANLTTSTTLTTNLNTTGTCLTIGNDSLTLDCAGYSITGDGGSNDDGVTASGQNNVSVLNCLIQNFSKGIDFTTMNNVNLTNNTLSNNTDQGALLSLNSQNATLVENTFNNNSFDGFKLTGNDFQIINNTFDSNGRFGVHLASSKRGNITDNLFLNLSYGVNLTGTSNTNSFKNNNFTLTTNGAFADHTSNSYNQSLLYNNSFGQINWEEILNLTVETDFSVDEQIFIGTNITAVNTTLIPVLNTSATITMYGLSIGDVDLIYKVSNFTTDSDDAEANGADCLANLTCSLESYNNVTGELSFTTTEFSSFTAAEDAAVACGSISADFTLTNDVTTEITCFTISANDLTLDCGGYSITGKNDVTAYGIYNNGFSNVTLTGCNVTNFTRGVWYRGVSNGFVQHSNLDSNTRGLQMTGGGNNQVTNITGNSNSQYGIFLSVSTYNNITDSATNNNNIDLYLDSNSDNNRIENNTVTGGGVSSGIYLITSSNNEVYSNDVSDHFANGIFVSSGSGNIVENNTVLNDAQGLVLSGGSGNNKLVNNNVSSTSKSINDASGGTKYNSLIYNNTNGQLHWNLTDLSTDNVAMQIGTKFIINENKTGLVVSATVSGLNTTASIEIRNLSFAQTPHLMRDDVVCDHQDYCNITSYSGGILTAEVSFFSTYSASNNTAPNITFINISNQPIYTNLTALGNITVTDLEGDNVTLNVTWYINETITQHTESIAVADGTNSIFNLSGGNYSKLAVLNFTVLAYDSTGENATQTVQVTVQNSVPKPAVPEFNQSSFDTGGVIGVNTTHIDADVDNGIVYLKWYKNNAQLGSDVVWSDTTNGTTVSTTLASTNYQKGDLINVSVKSNDGTGDSALSWSTTINISNTAPSITNTQTSVVANTSTNFTLDFEASDADVTDGVDILNWSSNNSIVLINNNTGIVSFLATESQVGTYVINISVNDTEDMDFDTFTLVINDTTEPSLNMSLPNETTYAIGTTSLDLNYSVADGNLGSCWYSLDIGVTNTTIASCLNVSITVSSGSQTLFLYANDTYGNINSTNLTFTVSVAASSETNTGGSGSSATPACNSDSDCSDKTEKMCDGIKIVEKTAPGVCKNPRRSNAKCTNGNFSEPVLVDVCDYKCEAGKCINAPVEEVVEDAGSTGGGSSCPEGLGLVEGKCVNTTLVGFSGIEELYKDSNYPTIFPKMFSSQELEQGGINCLFPSGNSVKEITQETFDKAIEANKQSKDLEFFYELSENRLKLIWLFGQQEGKKCIEVNVLKKEPSLNSKSWKVQNPLVKGSSLFADEFCVKLKGKPTLATQEFVICEEMKELFESGAIEIKQS
ncbi:hypothetical protein HOC13_02515, partial [Candidatus Woesearchaeota archaeon]|nr:hypothetical protein [Candidatus Woesearchaeota archaeon]